MLRRNVQPNGSTQSGHGAPPSTLAAQLVQNQNQNAEKAMFKELLHETLHNGSAAQETDLNINAQLIGIVAEVGLKPLALDNPFADSEALLTQGIDSLLVVEKAVQNQPAVLSVSVTPNGPQVVLALLATLFSICGRPKTIDLPIDRLLASMLQSLRRSAALWKQAYSIKLVLQSCVDEVLSALEIAPTASSALNGIVIPPARSIASLWAASDSTITAPTGLQTSITDTNHAIMLCVIIATAADLDLPWQRNALRRVSKLIAKFETKLQESGLWISFISILLKTTVDVQILSQVSPCIERHGLDISVQSYFARALFRCVEQGTHHTNSALQACTQNLIESSTYNMLGDDLKIALAAVYHRISPAEYLPEHVVAMEEALQGEDVMSDSDLVSAFQRLSTHNPYVGFTRKRSGMSRGRIVPAMASRPVEANEVLRRATQLLTGVARADLVAMPSVACAVYLKLSQDDKCAAWQALIDLAAHDLHVTIQTCLKLLELKELHQTKRCRVLSILAIQACVERTTNAEYVTLATSTFGRYCLASLHSSLRELRIAAGKALRAFLRNDLPSDLRSQNRQLALKYLRDLSPKDNIGEHETLIAAWGTVAITCSDKELNLALLRLVEYLGHGNSLICAAASSELEHVAMSRGQSTSQLFEPFWRSVAVSVVQDLTSRPQKLQQMCELLGMNANQFLHITEEYTLPILVLKRKHDVLQKLANARGNGSTIEDICLSPRRNLAAILGLLLSQTTTDVEEAVLTVLTDIAPGFRSKDFDLLALIKMEAAFIACEMLKQCGDESESNKTRAYQSFNAFAMLAEGEKPSTARKASAKPGRALASFFDDKVLGILTAFSVNISVGLSALSSTEKTRCLKGIAEMFTLTRGNIVSALPQIKACLRSGLDQIELCETAFSAWLSMLNVLDGEEVANVIDETFVLITKHWSQLSTEVQTRTHKTIGELVRAHNQILQESIMTVPSLSSIPQLAKFDAEFERFKKQDTVQNQAKAFTKRLKSDSSAVVLQTLFELVPFLESHQDWLHETATSDTPEAALADFVRALLDATVKYSSQDKTAAELCGKALGIVGCLDPNRIEAPRLKRLVLVLSNFETASEAVDWALTLLEDVMVKAFQSATNARAQGFLAYTMQELLRFCKVEDSLPRFRGTQSSDPSQRWNDIPERVRTILTPFLTSKYVVTSNVPIAPPNRDYPEYTPDMTHDQWLRSITYDLMFRAKGDNAKVMFSLLARTIRGHDDLSIAHFVFPYAVLNVVLGGTTNEAESLTKEFLQVFKTSSSEKQQQESVRLCIETLFSVLDLMSVWLLEKKKALATSRAEAYKTGHASHDFDEATDMGQIESVEKFLGTIPAQVVADAALDCGSFARALYHWERHLRASKVWTPSEQPNSKESAMHARLLEIYTEIDEPDGLEGMSSRVVFIDEQQRAANHKKAGRWTAAQAWYDVKLSEAPTNQKIQHELLGCLRQTGRYAPLLRYIDSFIDQANAGGSGSEVIQRLLPLAAEACWMSNNLAGLSRRLKDATVDSKNNFPVGIGKILLLSKHSPASEVLKELNTIRRSITESMSLVGTESLQACHASLLQLHVLYELDALISAPRPDDVLPPLDRRLAVVGSYLQDKQTILGVRRAVMDLRPDVYDRHQVGALWLSTARLARQTNDTHNAYDAVLRATECGEQGAKLEGSRLLWHDGHQRQAIQALEKAIASGAFNQNASPRDGRTVDLTESTDSVNSDMQNALLGKAQLLLAKWLDASGQSQMDDMSTRYQVAARSLQRSERGHYYLSKHYTRLLDVQKALPKEKRAEIFATGEMTKIIMDNCLRSLPFGSKYWHETIPRLLTLWLELGVDALHRAPKEDQTIFEKRTKTLQACNRQIQKYFERVPAYVFHHALPQLISRLTHPHPDIWKQLSNILTRIASAHPSQVLWSLLAVVKANDRVRVERGTEILNRLKDPKLKFKTDSSNGDLRAMITHGQRLSDALLLACEEPVEARAQRVSLSKDLRFNVKLAPSALVVPIEATLNARSPPAGANSEQIKRYKAFAHDKITIAEFRDEVVVLSSLQRPRKISVRGSDGRVYGLLCKPKDDLRKDQRLMEFNGIINRALKRDTESSKRRLYIKTYAVTPLSEESGTIEWVEGIKPIRDILLGLYQRKGIRPNYSEIRKKLDEACQRPENAHIFVQLLKDEFPPILHEWFTETYPEPETWLAARLRYARSAAVMSMTGHVLGLGDRHGENILLEESTGGVFHVDFNCLFDKGLTFEKPEMVPFRLTHNMVDAMGMYGYEGPFRKSSELTLSLLRQERDTLMTVLETFLYDPTTDFVGKKKKSTPGVPDTPAEILESVATKLKGLFKAETVPLSVEGYVDALIQDATNPYRLACMYIGWCSFL